MDAMRINAGIAFLAGLTSFFSACVLATLPVYIASLAGTLDYAREKRLSVFRNGFLFTLGFSLVFIAMGAAATALGRFIQAYETPLRVVSGALVILFGLFTMDLLPLNFLLRERKLDMSAVARKAAAPGMAFLLGVGFGLGWTPCYGAQLGVVLLLAANSRHMLRGIGYLALYALGMGLPFLIIAAMADRLLPWTRKLLPHAEKLKRVCGALLVLLGVLMITGWMSRISAFLAR